MHDQNYIKRFLGHLSLDQPPTVKFFSSSLSKFGPQSFTGIVSNIPLYIIGLSLKYN